MNVETYEVVSNDPSLGDNSLIGELESPEALALIDSLGLKGQRALLVESKETGAPVRNPYRQMTVSEAAVYGVMLPQRTTLEEYNEGPIPLRVMQVAAHAKALFPRLEVWYEQGSRDDPLLVGCDDGSEWRVRVRHMLARWGDVLLPMDELIVKATPKLRALWEKQVGDGLRERQSFLQSIDAQVAAHLNGHHVHVPA